MKTNPYEPYADFVEKFCKMIQEGMQPMIDAIKDAQPEIEAISKSIKDIRMAQDKRYRRRILRREGKAQRGHNTHSSFKAQ